MKPLRLSTVNLMPERRGRKKKRERKREREKGGIPAEERNELRTQSEEEDQKSPRSCSLGISPRIPFATLIRVGVRERERERERDRGGEQHEQ